MHIHRYLKSLLSLFIILLCVTFSTIVHAQIQTGTVALWHAEGNALDSVGSNHGTLQGGTAFGAGKFGQAFSFDGVDDAISVGMLNNTALNETMPFSISAWVNSSDTTPYQSMMCSQ